MAKPFNYMDFVVSSHPSYNRYLNDWLLSERSLYGGVEYREGEYLKAYTSDFNTPSEIINTYDVDENGNQLNSYRSQVQRANSPQDANDGGSGYASNFYYEKLQNVPVFPYARLYTSEYNAILFRSPPSRNLPDTPEVEAFVKNTDGQGNSLNEFMSQVDTFTTTFGVVWISCIKTVGSDVPKWRMHKPTDVTNWSYTYNAEGDLELNRIIIRISSEPDMEVYQYITADTMDTIFRPLVEEDELMFEVPEGAEKHEGEDSYFYRISQDNPLGYIPVRPVYQSTPIQNGIGHTPLFDIAQIQRSVYSDMGEIYSAVSYGAHPVNIVDEDTLNRNGNSVGAEPGAVIITGASLDGQPNYVYNFVSPSLDSVTELRQIMDQKISKMNEIAMIRSEELIKASRSGVQIEQYDSKLEAFIRKKATAMENAEYNLWKIWFDWMDQDIPDDLTISYNRLYSQKGLEHEIKEMNTLLDAYERYHSVFLDESVEYTIRDYTTEAEAEAEAQRLGGTGTHSHEAEDGTTIYMPFTTHEEYELRMEMVTGTDMTEAPEFKQDLKDKLKERLKQLVDSTYTNNSL